MEKIALYILTFMDMIFKIFWIVEIATSWNYAAAGMIMAWIVLIFEWTIIRTLRIPKERKKGRK